MTMDFFSIGQELHIQKSGWLVGGGWVGWSN